MWLLVFSTLFNLWAIEPLNSAIEQAQSLALKKNRVEACAILNRTLKDLPPAKRGKVAGSLDQISKLFFTDKGQKIFEAGQASMWETPDLAIAQFREALALEDQNVQILNNLARLQLLKQECDGALESLAASRKINPILAETALLELRALACKQNFAVMREKAKSLPPLGKWEESYVQYLLALDSAQQKSWRKASEAMTKLSEEEPQFPESYWIIGQAATELEKDNERWLQKYVSLCKAVTARERKQFSLEPRLCANQKEAEIELAKNKTL